MFVYGIILVNRKVIIMKRIIGLLLVLILTVSAFTGCSILKDNEIIDDLKEGIVDGVLGEEVIIDGNTKVDSELEELTLAQSPLENILEEERIYEDYVFLNGHKFKDENIEDFHGILFKLKKDNGVFIISEMNDIPAIKWGNGDAPIQCFIGEAEHKAPTNPQFVKIDSGEGKNFTYDLYRYEGFVDPDLNEYSVYVDYGCTECVVTMRVDFWWETWTDLSGNDDFDNKAKLVMEELAPFLEIRCSCCDK